MRVLAIGAHPDDIEVRNVVIQQSTQLYACYLSGHSLHSSSALTPAVCLHLQLGCGATLALHVSAGDEVTMLVMTNGESGPGEVSSRRAEQEKAARILGCNVLWGNLPDGQIANHENEAIKIIESAIRKTGCTRMYTHYEFDSHQDHRSVALASLGAGRHLREILAYEAPSSRRFNGTLAVDIGSTLQLKIDALACHASQVKSSARVDLSHMKAQALYYGARTRCPAAELFAVERLVLDIGNFNTCSFALTNLLDSGRSNMSSSEGYLE